MHLILCHTTADFDALGAAVGLTRLIPGAKLVLPGGTQPGVHDFLALYRDEYAIATARSINPHQIQTLSIVDTQQRERLGQCQAWLDLPQLTAIRVYDHHLATVSNIAATQRQIAPVGATTTIITELLQQQHLDLTVAEATVMALGIHVDTGSLTFASTTPRDAAALAWLLSQGAGLESIAEYREQRLSAELQQLLPIGLEKLQTNLIHGYQVSWVMLETSHFVTGLSGLIAELMTVTSSDILLLGASHPLPAGDEQLVTIIGRAQVPGVDLSQPFQQWGGGGHPQAAALHRRAISPLAVMTKLLAAITTQIPAPITAREMMSSPVRTIRPDLPIAAAQRLLLRYGHSGLCVVVDVPATKLVGVISRRDIDLAYHHGFAHAPVKGYMRNHVQTITPTTTLAEIQALLVTHDIGRLPVLAAGELVGIVTRTDVLRHRYRLENRRNQFLNQLPTTPIFTPLHLPERLLPALWQVLQTAARLAQERGWQLYLVGGAVRDLILAPVQTQSFLSDLDLVVDGFDRSADEQAGVELAQALHQCYPAARIDIHGQFQTAALLWHQDPVLDSLCLDIATARTEFYPYPAANPEVAASSIQQDLYRRDFTINALAMRLTQPQAGEILDFFGGLPDLQTQQLRVLHANSFIEDPTRIYRGVRFAVRLGFTIEPQTIAYIKYAIASGVYDRTLVQNAKAPALQTRLQSELKYILQTDYWLIAIEQLNELDALQCLHPQLQLDPETRRRLQLVDEILDQDQLQLNLSPWLLRLEILLTALAPSERERVAQQLQLSTDSQQRLVTLDQSQQKLMNMLEQERSIGQLVSLLQAYPATLLLLVAIALPAAQSQILQQYLTNWSQIKAPITGHDLKILGYKPGVQYKKILDALLVATLDGIITDRQQAIEFLQQHYAQTESRSSFLS
jgi:tRNA nucleotidyltransferase (CCA-adding enzyme)